MTSLDFKIDLVLASLFMLSICMNTIPKKHKGLFWDFLRNNYHKHVFLGGLFGMILSTTFDGVFEGMQIFLTLFVTGMLCTMWEWGWKAINNSEIDYKDVYWGVGAALVAVLYKMI
jgi:hypothetical protein